MTINDKVYDLITLRGPLTNQQIWAALGTVKLGSVRTATRRLADQGLIQTDKTLRNQRRVKVYYVE